MKSISPALFSVMLLIFISPSYEQQKGIDDDVLKYTNQFRRANGLTELRMNEDLSKIAEKHSEDMAKGRCAFGHSGFDKREREASKKMHCTAFAENVAFGAETGRQVVDLWKNSPGHRQNLLGHYKYMGIGVSKSRDGSLYYTQVFAQ
jgi:uncharacterized protein YkwD